MKYVSPYLNQPLTSTAVIKATLAKRRADKFDRWYKDQTNNIADTRQGMTHGQCVALERGQ